MTEKDAIEALDFPKPPTLSGGTKVRPFLRWLAEQEDKRSAACRARELRVVADWLDQVSAWGHKAINHKAESACPLATGRWRIVYPTEIVLVPRVSHAIDPTGWEVIND